MKYNNTVFKHIEFIASYPGISKMQIDEIPEFAFIGRSNVGKSSLINMLCDRKALAKVSSTPGKTQLINAFLINKKWRLIDLPGYGYAKTSKSLRSSWGKMIENYLSKRENICCAFILVDSRVDPQTIDIEFIEWCAENNIPMAIVFTKIDKLTKNQLIRQVQVFKNKLSSSFTELPNMFVTSSSTKEGRTEVLEFINEIIISFEKHMDESSEK